ncbi:hypothetical protein FOXYS1_4319 [Fusarium oxysporum]|uniref:CCHC-type domain-containing protein n=1 Tax=Fusarium oxysporum TaxID=5507 RepID=A0A8H5ELF8_FUSOX|nr:hypothetical protein FOXYS1_4319 [Fusarium oxysporum]
MCWDYHFARNCHRQPVCQRCGKTGHIVDDCAAWEQCVNCLGPHEASLRQAIRQRRSLNIPGQAYRTQKNDKKLLKVFQANVGKIPPAHDCALALADTERYDIIWPFEMRDILWITVNGMMIVNFYCQNDEKDALNTLLRWPVPERCLVAGDFNARYHNIPTNPYGNTIDLAFTNLPLAEAIVEDHLATSSDYFTLSLTFPEIRSTPTQSGKIRVTTEDEVKRFVEIVELGAIEIPVTDSTPKELDELASSLVNLLTSAVKAAGRPARKGGCLAPWWTEECADAAAAFRAVR